MRFFHNQNDNFSKRSLNIGRMTIPMLRAEHRFQIFVKLCSGETIAMHVRSSDDVRDVQVWFLNLLEPVQRQIHRTNCYLAFESKALWDGYKLRDFNIRKNCTIRQQVRLRGGGLELADVNMEEIIMTEY